MMKGFLIIALLQCILSLKHKIINFQIRTSISRLHFRSGPPAETPHKPIVKTKPPVDPPKNTRKFQGAGPQKQRGGTAGANKVQTKFLELTKFGKGNTNQSKIQQTPNKEQSKQRKEPEIDLDLLRRKKLYLMERVSAGIIPIAASFGFAVTPSTKIVTRIAGAAAGGAVGVILKKYWLNGVLSELSNPRSEQDKKADGFNGELPAPIMKAIEKLSTIKTSILKMERSDLLEIAISYGVKEVDMYTYLTLVTSEALYWLVTDTEEEYNLIELSPFIEFVERLFLDTSQLSNAFTLAIIRVNEQLVRTEEGWLESTVDTQVLLRASKLLFLVDKCLNTESNRQPLSALQHMHPMELYRDVLSFLTKEMFLLCIEEMIRHPRQYTKQDLLNLQSYLTPRSTEVSNFNSEQMNHYIIEVIQKRVSKHLQANETTPMNVSLQPILPELRRLQKLIGLTDSELLTIIETQTTPVFEEIVNRLLEKVEGKPQTAEILAPILVNRLEALYYNPVRAGNHLRKVIEKYNTEFMDEAERLYLKFEPNLEPVYLHMQNYAVIYEGLRKFVAPVLPLEKIPAPNLRFNNQNRYKLHNLRYQKQKEQQQLSSSRSSNSSSSSSSSSNERSEIMNMILGFNEDVHLAIEKTISLPKVTRWIEQCLRDRAVTDSAKSAYQKLLQEYRITTEEWRATASEIYYQHLRQLSELRSVPTSEDIEYLEQVRGFLDLTSEEDAEMIYQMKLELFGEKYMKALTESMTPTGVITEEYLPGLDRLRARLGLKEEDTLTLLGVAIRQRLQPIFRDLVDVWKSDTDPEYRRAREIEKQRQQQEDDNDDNNNYNSNNYNSRTKLLPAKKKNKLETDPISSGENVFGFMEVTTADGQVLARRDSDNDGMKTFMREALNIVDFVLENYRIFGSQQMMMSSETTSTTDSTTDTTTDTITALDETPTENTEESPLATTTSITTTTTTTPPTTTTSSSSTPNPRTKLLDGIFTRENFPINVIGAQRMSTLIELYKYYVITRISEPNPTLRRRYEESEEAFACILGLTVDGCTRAKESLAFTAMESLLREAIQQRGEITTEEIQQYLILKNSLQLDDRNAEIIYNQAARSALSDYADVLFEAVDYGTPPITIEKARQLRLMVQGLGFEMNLETIKNPTIVGLLFALEVQYLIDHDRMDELLDLKEIYSIPEDILAEITESVCRKYLTQLLSLALRGAKRHDAVDCVRWTRQVMKYLPYITGTVDVDGNVFTEETVGRMVGFHTAEVDAARERDPESYQGVDPYEEGELLKRSVNLSKSFIPPIMGIEGLIRSLPTSTELISNKRSNWTWS